MPKHKFENVLDYLRTVFQNPADRDLSDAELLSRFLTKREEAAFTLLVQRHGPMVLSVCRRILGDVHSAEESFQATFIVLSRRAGSLRSTGSLANWLYGVAQRIASKARAQRTARHDRERPLQDIPSAEALDELTRRELRTILDEEIACLAPKYRSPIVLCYFEDKSYEQAARELGCTKSTLAKRLTRARELLRRRLVRRGMALSAGALATALCNKAAGAHISALVTIKTVKAAVLAASGKAVLGGSLSTGALALAEEAMNGMSWIKVKVLLAVTALGVAVGGAGWAGYVGLAQKLEPALKAHAQPPVTKDTPPTPVKETKRHVDRYGDPLPEGAIARLGTVRFRHGGGHISSLLLSSDGKTLVSNTHYGDGLICAWDMATGKLRHQFPGHFEENGAVALSPDGNALATGDGGLIHLWDLASGREVRQLKAPLGRLQGLAYSPDGKMLASGHAGRAVLLWDLATGTDVARLEAKHNRLTFLAFTSDGKTLATGDSLDQTVRLFDVPTRKERHQVTRPNAVRGFALSPDSSLLALGGQEGHASIWNVRTGKLVHELAGASFVDGVAFSPDGNTLAVAEFDSKTDRNAIIFWDVATGAEIHRLQDKVGAIWRLAYAPDGKTLIVGSGGTIRLLDATTGEERGPAPGNPGYVGSVAVARPGRIIAYIADSSVRLWDLTAAAEVGRLPGHHWSIALSPDGQTLAGGTDVNKVNLWDVASQRFVRQLKCDPKQGGYDWVAYYRTAFSSDGKLVASAGRGVLANGRGADGVVQLWDLATGQERHRLSLNDPAKEFIEAAAVAFSPDGQTLAASGRLRNDGSNVRLWDLATGHELTRLNARLNENADGGPGESSFPDGPVIHPPRIVFSPDGKLLAMNRMQKTIPIWDATTGKERLRLHGHETSTVCVAFSPDGRTLVSSGLDNTIRLWDLVTGQSVGELKGHRGAANSLAFTGDGRTLISAGDDATLLLWDVAGMTQRERRMIQLAPEEWETRWAELSGRDAARAHAAIIQLTAAGPSTVEKLKTRLTPATAIEAARLAQLLRDLESDLFAVRAKATHELERLGAQARAAIDQALARPGASLELKLRLERIRDQLAIPSGDALRKSRAIEVLEHIGSPEAQTVLESLARGAPGARETEEAKASLERLVRRVSSAP